MKVIFFGLGSVAKRHITCLQALAPDTDIHAYRVVRNSAPPPGVTDIYRLSEVARGAYDIAFITNPTHLHIPTATFAATTGIPNLFIEKPLGVSDDHLANLLQAIDDHHTDTYVAYPFRHHPKLANLVIHRDELAAYSIKCHTDLPSWHPTGPSPYSLSPATGGGAILELSHEFDLSTHLFGPIVYYKLKLCVGVKGLPGNVEVAVRHIDGRRGAFSLRLYGTWPTERELKVGPMTVAYRPTQDMYLMQMDYFLNRLGSRRMTNNIDDAAPLFRVLADMHRRSVRRIAKS